ncbi:MAG: T9SS type A sorting domain-containing protein [Ignavibacteria bacterium]|nr:T9SS type A sorting domain-containing protein [Ignavibacteria bacterium]
MLGNEIMTLVNQKQTAGSYEVGFNASALSSGIYFYTLKTEGFSETKRMLLVK